MSRGLLVYVPSLEGTAKQSNALEQRLLADLPGSWEVKRWEHDLSPVSRMKLEDCGDALSTQIRLWAGLSGDPNDVGQIILVGHSVGGLLVRYAYLLDVGAVPESSLGLPSWSPMVTRIVLLAAPNAGFQQRNLPWYARVMFPVVAPFGSWTAEQLRAGSPFITGLRLRWIDHFRSAEHPPQVVQVLGGQDQLVTTEDSRDVEYMPDAMAIPVPGAGHGNLVEVTLAPDDDERYPVLRHAIMGDLNPDALKATPPGNHRGYFVLHGIRTGSYATWVERLSTALYTKDPQARVYAPSYGYFSALGFAVPTSRRRNLRRFLDWYSHIYVSHHKDQLFFAGHSNGTYLLGRALKDVPAVSFQRIYLAGSVLPTTFPWPKVVARKQVGQRVRNDLTTSDLPVGIFCALLRGLGMRDLGTAGVNGFNDKTEKGFRYPLAFVGGHGDALKLPKQINDVATFLVTGASNGHPTGTASKPFLFVSRLIQNSAAAAVLLGAFFAVRGAFFEQGGPGVGGGVLIGVTTFAVIAKSG